MIEIDVDYWFEQTKDRTNPSLLLTQLEIKLIESCF